VYAAIAAALGCHPQTGCERVTGFNSEGIGGLGISPRRRALAAPDGGRAEQLESPDEAVDVGTPTESVSLPAPCFSVPPLRNGALRPKALYHHHNYVKRTAGQAAVRSAQHKTLVAPPISDARKLTQSLSSQCQPRRCCVSVPQR
jgi:hypothetical protein